MFGVQRELVLVEDNLDDERLSLRAIAHSDTPCHVTVKRDGAEALEYLLQPLHPVPALIVLDFQLPKHSGLEVLQRLRAHAPTRLIPIVVFSGTNGGKTLNECYGAGANSCIGKPTRMEDYMERLGGAVHYWLALNEAPDPVSSVPEPADRTLTVPATNGAVLK